MICFFSAILPFMKIVINYISTFAFPTCRLLGGEDEGRYERGMIL